MIDILGKNNSQPWTVLGSSGPGLLECLLLPAAAASCSSFCATWGSRAPWEPLLVLNVSQVVLSPHHTGEMEANWLCYEQSCLGTPFTWLDFACRRHLLWVCVPPVPPLPVISCSCLDTLVMSIPSLGHILSIWAVGTAPRCHGLRPCAACAWCT